MPDKREHTVRQAYTEMSTAALFTLAEMWTQLKFPLNRGFMDTVHRYSCTIECSPVMKQNNVEHK